MRFGMAAMICLIAGCVSSSPPSGSAPEDPEVQKWIRLLKNDHPEVFRLGQEKLIALGLRALPDLSAHLDAPNRPFRERVHTVVFLIAAAHEAELDSLDPNLAGRIQDLLEERFLSTLALRTGSKPEWAATFVPVRFPLTPYLRLYVKREYMGTRITHRYLVNGLNGTLEPRGILNIVALLDRARVPTDSRSRAENLAQIFVTMTATHETDSLHIRLERELDREFIFDIEGLPHCEVCVQSEVRDLGPHRHGDESGALTLTVGRDGSVSFRAR